MLPRDRQAQPDFIPNSQRSSHSSKSPPATEVPYHEKLTERRFPPTKEIRHAHKYPLQQQHVNDTMKQTQQP